MADLNVNSIGDASGGNTATINGYAPTVSNMAGRNRIINGDMRIDQRASGASTTPSASGYHTVDRFGVFFSQVSKLTIGQNLDAVTPPTNFTNYLGTKTASAVSVAAGDYFFSQHVIEGFNIADLGWGTANAKTVTLSFKVYSSITGTFGGAVLNNGSARSYPFSYIISSANTWTDVSITIEGDTSGTWLTNNGVGMYIRFGLGSGSTFTGASGAWTTGNYVQPTGSVSVVGTSGATFYITGVQLEEGSVATPFEHRMYGQELALCQRYYEVLYNDSGTTGIFVLQYGSGVFRANWFFKQDKRASATVALASGASWGGATPSIQGGISEARLDASSGTYSIGTANTPSLYAAAEL